MGKQKGNKIVIIGMGFVGSSTAFSLIHSGLVNEMVLMDVNEDKAKGEALDLSHGISFVRPIDIRVGDYKDCAGADIIIISAGPSIKPGETRLQLAEKNSNIMKGIMDNIMKYTRDAIILVASNPVDILTYVAATSGYDKEKVIGTGTVLDSARLRYSISKHCDIDLRSIHGYVIGEHGDSEVVAWSLTNICGTRIDKKCSTCENHCYIEDRTKMFEEVRDAGYSIIERKGHTSYGIALSIRRIAESILRDENSVLTVASLLQGEYGLKDVALSVPTIVNRKGIHKILELPLEDNEMKLLRQSANKLKDIISDLKTPVLV
jgi:L-lactate dehydrogenase